MILIESFCQIIKADCATYLPLTRSGTFAKTQTCIPASPLWLGSLDPFSSCRRSSPDGSLGLSNGSSDLLVRVVGMEAASGQGSASGEFGAQGELPTSLLSLPTWVHE